MRYYFLISVLFSFQIIAMDPFDHEDKRRPMVDRTQSYLRTAIAEAKAEVELVLAWKKKKLAEETFETLAYRQARQKVAPSTRFSVAEKLRKKRIMAEVIRKLKSRKEGGARKRKNRIKIKKPSFP
ncbi:MAG: hypothetical protein CMM87_05895 [Rickettsiales bacterium]|nr:hypothetical protein [Rickettsiales bacterium]|tara:strand:- start:110 stop:487 length:378 start_codon:yes stop_codon:yes gene_type:complete